MTKRKLSGAFPGKQFPRHMASNPRKHDSEASCSHGLSRYHIGTKAQEILATQDVTRLGRLVTNLCYRKETEESPFHQTLYLSFAKHFPNILAVKLLQLYRSDTVSPKIQSFTLTLLDALLIQLEDSRVFLKQSPLEDLKTNLNALLFQQETSDHDFKLLSRIISRVAVEIFLDNNPWDELLAYILSLDMNRKALLIFTDLPILLEDEFLMPLLDNDLRLKIVDGLMKNQDRDHEEDWCLALEAAFSLMLHCVTLKKTDVVVNLVYVMMVSICEMVNVRKREVVVRQGFTKLAMKVRREAMRFRELEYEVVSDLVSMMQKIRVGEITKMALKTIHEVLDKFYIGG